MWRGPALADLSSHLVSAEAAWLEEQRLTAAEQHAALSLELGRHHQIVPQLTALVQEQPLREEARATLMLALYRSGRRSEALTLFRQARQVFVEELGLEPGRALQTLHDAILRDDPALMPAPVAATTATVVAALPGQAVPQLPADVPLLAGREAELAALGKLLCRGEDGAVGLIVGQPGVGKTALAVHWAREVAAEFPDGQLLADLRLDAEDGEDPTGAVLGRLLIALGVPEDRLPEGRQARSAVLRQVVAGRRMLIVCDDIPAGVRLAELLPGDGACCLLATSRAQQCLQCVPGPVRISLAPLRLDEGVTLLAALVGEGRMREDRSAAEQVAALCEGLPLALTAAAARLGVKQHWTFADLVARLRDPRRRLDELSCVEPGLRAAFDIAYHDLKPALARTYRRLGRTDPAELDVETGAVLLRTSPGQAENLMEQLTDAGMLGVVGRCRHGRFRYRMPGLLALHARERARLEDSQVARLPETIGWRAEQGLASGAC